MKTIIHTDRAPAAIGPYSQATMIRAGKGLLFTAGQLALDPTSGQLVGEDARGQTRQVMANLRAVLAAAGIGFEAVLKATIFLKDLEDYPQVNEVYGECFGENPPARSAVQVARLPKDALVEIEMIAVVES